MLGDVYYLSDEDTFAALCEDGRGSEQVEIILAERLLKQEKNSRGKSGLYNKHQLSINDPAGLIRCLWFEPVIISGVHVEVAGELAYRLSLHPKAGLNTIIPCAACIAIVEVKYHRAHQVYTLASQDQQSVDTAMADRHASEPGQAGTEPPRTRFCPPSRPVKRLQKKARRVALKSILH